METGVSSPAVPLRPVDAQLQNTFDEDAKLSPSGRRECHADGRRKCVFLFEKAIYELGYELNHRPDWLGIPLKGLEYLTKSPRRAR
jgi:predicted trehalose synthase